MVKQLITAFPTEIRQPRKDGSSIINIAEFFTDTIQGEGINAGTPATFLRVKNCTLNCGWCDTSEVWKKGNPYSVDELVEMMQQNGVIDRLNNGQHLVLTGGSPLLYQTQLTELINKITKQYGIKPYVEVENESTRMPTDEFTKIVDCWNNSPKLANSGMSKVIRNKPEVIKYLVKQPNSWFKFVVTKKEDWDEIVTEYLQPNNIPYKRVLLMPEGQTREQLQQHYDFIVDLCNQYGLRMTDRMHISMWDKKTGV